MTDRDTVYALSSGGLPSGVAVIRLSGPATARVIEALAGSLPRPREMSLRSIVDPNGSFLDRGLIAYFPAPRSFTGEDCGELHIHGGRAVVAAVLETLGRQAGLRAAEAGEFTRRAFLEGKLDLTRAEGLADLIQAESEAERRLALATSGGVLDRLYSGWRDRLLQARALIEADLDFSDESDIPGSVADGVWPGIAALAQDIRKHMAGYKTAEMVREGFRVVILGAPNAGKSSLLNAMAGREAAIVTDIPGTTRDIVQVTLDLGGYRVLLSDTAGLRESDDAVERIGVARARESAKEADLLLLLSDGTVPWATVSADVPGIRVRTKLDLYQTGAGETYDIGISALRGDGLNDLIDCIKTRVVTAMDTGDRVVPTRSRHVNLLSVCVAALDRAGRVGPDQLELAAEELRLAADSLGRITGAIDVEDVLGSIFSTFCVGK